MGSVVYIDVDDEITSAAARIRGSADGPVALVVPHGSRVATSRINFRLLAREAQSRGRRLSIVAGDGATRALAASAGLPVFGSVGEYEGAAAPDGADADDVDVLAPASRPRPNRTPAASPSSGVVAAPLPPRGGRIAATAVAAAAVPEAQTVALPLPARAARWPQTIVLPADRRTIAGVAVAVAVVVLGLAAFLLLPSASIAITPREEPMTPLSVTVRADPDAASPDAAAGVVPAKRLSFDLAASDTFAVMGRRVDEAKATGRVTFRSKDYLRENRIVSGSIVSTTASVKFRTTATVVVPRAQIVGFVIVPGTASVGVEAVQPGTEGNVEPNAITVIPRDDDPLFLDVRNREPTTGGKHDEFPKVDQADVDAAIAQLTKELGQDFDTLIAEPSRVPAGTTVFRETRAIGDAQPTTDTAALIGQEVESFELEVRSTGTVVGVEDQAIRALAADRLRATVDAEHRVVDGSVAVEVGGATVSGEAVTLQVTATGKRARVVDANAIAARIKGRPIAQARSILAEYGDVRIGVWPDWVTSIPTIDARIDLRVASPSGEAATPTAAPSAP
ncbi:MAG TPA: baseplate J/gp47 family protein [Candidatus Limnocylindrales bacterium]|nr:baseplate J/gp47 family protein [Candidatus Limnocylindrales bacterium]